MGSRRLQMREQMIETKEMLLLNGFILEILSMT